MYAYDIEEEDTLSDHWVISATNVTIIGNYTSFEVINSVSTYSVSMVTITTGNCCHIIILLCILYNVLL